MFYCATCEMWYNEAQPLNVTMWNVPANQPDPNIAPFTPEQNTITPTGEQKTRIVIDRKKYFVHNEKEDENELVIVIEPKK